MTSRFVRPASRSFGGGWVALVVFVSTIVFPNAASANTENKTRLVFEIKSIQDISIPTVTEISNLINPQPSEQKVAIAAIEMEENIKIEEKQANNKVYMHEPEIRNYICPKMGQAPCNIFIAVLKAENGTHECTRDNAGLNRNGSIDVGLAQINWNPKYNPPYTVEQLRDCKFNLDIALQKYKARGFQPWYAYTKGAYKKFLK